MSTIQPFDPLALGSLGESLVRELNSRQAFQLPPEDKFPGCGVYALYYMGNFEPYRALRERGVTPDDRPRVPIYLGKADPSGSQAASVPFRVTGDPRIYERLRKHRLTIRRAENLRLDDFYYRFLVTAPVWIGLAESVAVTEYRPLWNTEIKGFGNNDPGKGRYDQMRSEWDTLHPGREWADKLEDRDESQRDIAEKAARLLDEALPPEPRPIVV